MHLKKEKMVIRLSLPPPTFTCCREEKKEVLVEKGSGDEI
jgi:hypothetical protein